VHRATLGVGSLSGNWATAVEFEFGQSHMPFLLRAAVRQYGEMILVAEGPSAPERQRGAGSMRAYLLLNMSQRIPNLTDLISPLKPPIGLP